MKLGLGTWSLLDLDVYAAVKAIGDAGLEYVELWGELPHAYPGCVDRRRLRDVLSAYDMAVSTHAPFTDLNPAAPDPQVRRAVQKVLEGFVEFSAGLGATMVTVHPGSVHNALLVEDAASSSVATIEKMVKAAGGVLSVNIENQAKGTSRYHYPLGSSLKSLKGLLARVEGAKCTLDTGHAYASGLDPMSMSRRLGGRVAEVHLSDNWGKADEHLVPGEGTARLKELSKRLAKTDALVCLEINPHLYSRANVMKGFETAKKMFF